MEQAESYPLRRRVRTGDERYWPEVENMVRDQFLERRNRALPVSRSDTLQDAERDFQLWWNELPQQRRDKLNFK
jgi:hypothetical protein